MPTVKVDAAPDGSLAESHLANDPRLPQIRTELEQMDTNKDGVLDKAEVAALVVKRMDAAAAAVTARTRATRILRYLLAVIAICVLMLAANGGLTTAVVLLASETAVAEDGTLQVKGRNAPIKVAEATQELELDSRLPDSVFAELKYLYLRSPTGGMVHLLVQGTSRAMDETAMFGSYVRIHTSVGRVSLDGDIMTFLEEGMGHVFTEAGFQVVTLNGMRQRRLAGAFELLGLFNSVPMFEGWNSTYDVPPKVPLTFTASARQLFACAYGADVDLCANSGVRADHRTTILGEEWAFSRVDMWADESLGKVRESYTDAPHLAGWAFEKVIDLTAKSVDLGQIWSASGEAYYCRTSVDADPTSFGPFGVDNSKLLAAYIGEEQWENETVLAFRIKHREVEGMALEYKVLSAGLSEDGASLNVLPKLVVLALSNGTLGRRFAFAFDTFTAVDSIDPSVFGWDGKAVVGALFNETVCVETLAYTTPKAEGSAPIIPIEMMIHGSGPFSSVKSAPDSTNFFWDLQLAPTTTAAEWNLTTSSNRPGSAGYNSTAIGLHSAARQRLKETTGRLGVAGSSGSRRRAQSRSHRRRAASGKWGKTVEEEAKKDEEERTRMLRATVDAVGTVSKSADSRGDTSPRRSLTETSLTERPERPKDVGEAMSQAMRSAVPGLGFHQPGFLHQPVRQPGRQSKTAAPPRASASRQLTHQISPSPPPYPPGVNEAASPPNPPDVVCNGPITNSIARTGTSCSDSCAWKLELPFIDAITGGRSCDLEISQPNKCTRGDAWGSTSGVAHAQAPRIFHLLTPACPRLPLASCLVPRRRPGPRVLRDD